MKMGCINRRKITNKNRNYMKMAIKSRKIQMFRVLDKGYFRSERKRGRNLLKIA
jgi:hypothetical protein